ncbi:MAG TPA: YdeI/OmpD-associated family protein [Thermoanaerobaculia bacterium]|nr:YdeI/OmpD-associated family protein [Thermoanaerobaculia bacterium]
MRSKTFKTQIVRDGSMCFIPVPFDPAPVFGKTRAPVKVTLNGYTFRSTIAAMGGTTCIPLRRSNREAAGLEGNETLDVRLDLDTDAREVEPPPDLVKALKAAPPAWQRWQELSFTHQREHVEAVDGAKKPETRARRIEAAVTAIAARPEKKRK